MRTEVQGFDAWAIVEIMGHQTYAGRVSEETIGGQALVRIDIPATDDQEEFTKLFGGAAIYCITPTTEAIARAMAKRYEHRPIALYDLPIEWQKKIKGNATPSLPFDADDHLVDHDDDFGLW